MSASTVTPKNRETIYKRLLEGFLKGGKDFILKRNFELGKGWEKELMHFQYLYLNLLCNFSCDVEYYFNEKLKELASLECETKINYSECLSNIESSKIIEELSKSTYGNLLCCLEVNNLCSPCEDETD